MSGLLAQPPGQSGETSDRLARAPAARPLELAIGIFGVAIVVSALMGWAFPDWTNLTAFFLRTQDALLLSVCLLIALGVRYVATNDAPRVWPRPPPSVVAVAIFLICWLGHWGLLGGYDLSRDEQMATFDAQVYRNGLFAQPLSPLWSHHVKALNAEFMTLGEHPIGWISAYLPMNAVLHALVGGFADMALTGPLLTAAGALALWNCARLLWPQDREAALVAVLLYALSGQILVAGMTAYAMPAHLTLNLFWLWFFLLNRPRYDLACLFVGLIATGLHQPLFHPLFAAPFLAVALRDRQWRRLALFGVGYAVICVFWLAWPMLTRQFLSESATAAPIGADYLSRLLQTIAAGDAARWPNMIANLLRFLAWQPWLLTPLMAAGLLFTSRQKWTVALAASFVLPILAMAVLLPYQGHGFGYRYVHGVLGAAILLAVEGWRGLRDQQGVIRSAFRWQVVSGLCVVAPLQFWFAHDLYAPYAKIDASIRDSAADYVIIGAAQAPFVSDLVLNRPDLTNRPLRLLRDAVDQDLLAAICQPGVKVAMASPELFEPVRRYFSVSAEVGDASGRALSTKLAAAGCLTSDLPPKVAALPGSAGAAP